MITHSIPLHPEHEAVRLDAYLLHNSAEFQSNQRRPAVIVCPGGGYLFTSDREAEPIAMRFAAQGYQTFVLRYSVRTLFPQPMLELAKAISLVRANADAWQIDSNRIAICGFSAGGHLCASLGVFWDKPFLYEPLGVSAEQIKPNALILCYPVIDLTLLSVRSMTIAGQDKPVNLNELMLEVTLGDPQPTEEMIDRYRTHKHVSAATPPTFLWHTADDERVPAHNALLFATALAEKQISYELHIFDHGIHGLALADKVTESQGRFVNPPCQIWIDLAVKWLDRQ